MSIIEPFPISTLFQGNVTIEAGLDTIDYGYGDLNVTRNITSKGSQHSINASTGALVLFNGGLSIANSIDSVSSHQGGSITTAGGIAIEKSAFIGLNFDVNGHSTLDQVTIDTSDGNFEIFGSHAVDIHVATSSNFILTEGDLTLKATTGIVHIESGTNVTIAAKEPGAGIEVETAGGGFTLNTRNNGAFSLNADGRTSNITLLSRLDNHNLNLHLLEETDSYFHILSETNGKRDPSDRNIIIEDALTLETTNQDGSIRLRTGNGSVFLQNDNSLDGKVDIKTGSNGFHVETGINGPITLNAYDSSYFKVNSTMNNNQTLSLELLGAYDGELRIYSESNLPDSAIDINAANGGITIESNKINIGVLQPSNVRSGSLTVDDTFVHINDANLNSNSSGGLTVKRYQIVSDEQVIGDVVENGSPMFSGQVGSNNSETTIKLTGNTNNTNLSNFWIKVMGNDDGYIQVRKIKYFDNATKLATIYSSEDDPDSSNRTIGLDWTKIPNENDSYSLYKCNYVYSYWDESTLTWRFSCSADKENSVESNVNVQANNINCNDIDCNAIISNTVEAEQIQTSAITTGNLSVGSINSIDLETYIAGFRIIELEDNPSNAILNETEGIIDLNTENKNFGLYMIFIRPEDEESNRPSAIFTVGKSPFFNYGNVVKFISIKGENNSQLELSWKDTFPRVSYKPYPTNSGIGKTRYTIKLIKL